MLGANYTEQAHYVARIMMFFFCSPSEFVNNVLEFDCGLSLTINQDEPPSSTKQLIISIAPPGSAQHFLQMVVGIQRSGFDETSAIAFALEHSGSSAVQFPA